jgi:hypothetical protein
VIIIVSRLSTKRKNATATRESRCDRRESVGGVTGVTGVTVTGVAVIALARSHRDLFDRIVSDPHHDHVHDHTYVWL